MSLLPDRVFGGNSAIPHQLGWGPSRGSDPAAGRQEAVAVAVARGGFSTADWARGSSASGEVPAWRAPLAQLLVAADRPSDTWSRRSPRAAVPEPVLRCGSWCIAALAWRMADRGSHSEEVGADGVE